MKASFDVTLSPKDLYRFNMYQTYTGFQGWSSIALGILGFVMAGISFQNGNAFSAGVAGQTVIPLHFCASGHGICNDPQMERNQMLAYHHSSACSTDTDGSLRILRG